MRYYFWTSDLFLPVFADCTAEQLHKMPMPFEINIEKRWFVYFSAVRSIRKGED